MAIIAVATLAFMLRTRPTEGPLIIAGRVTVEDASELHRVPEISISLRNADSQAKIQPAWSSLRDIYALIVDRAQANKVEVIFSCANYEGERRLAATNGADPALRLEDITLRKANFRVTNSGAARSRAHSYSETGRNASRAGQENALWNINALKKANPQYAAEIDAEIQALSGQPEMGYLTDPTLNGSFAKALSLSDSPALAVTLAEYRSYIADPQSSTSVKDEILKSLARAHSTTDPDSLQTFRTISRAPGNPLQSSAMYLLLALGEPADKTSISASITSDSDLASKAAAFIAFGEAGLALSTETINSVAGGTNDSYLRAAALYYVNSQPAISANLDWNIFLSDDSPDVRFSAVRALDRSPLADGQKLSLLRRVRQIDASYKVRLAANSALESYRLQNLRPSEFPSLPPQ